MPQIGKGVAPPADFEDIIEDLFQNEKIKGTDDAKVKLIFSATTLSDDQKNALTYPSGFVPLNIFIVYTENKYDGQDTLIDSNIHLVSFLTKGDGFFYGYYFDITGLTLDNHELKHSDNPIVLPPEAVIADSHYLEVFCKVKDTTTILGLSTEDPLSASLQYIHDSKYYYTSTQITGVIDPFIPKTELSGLSDNLEKLKKHAPSLNLA